MMPIRGSGWDLAVFVLALAGFALLALASDREGRAVVGQAPSPWRKRVLRGGGWPLLLASLVVAVQGWRGNFGPVVWLGWLTMAALTVVFMIALVLKPRTGRGRGRGRAGAGADPTGLAKADLAPAAPGGRLARCARGLVATVVVALPVLVGWALAIAPDHPLARSGAVEGRVGPWAFRLAEEAPGPPELTAIGVPIKHVLVRFCAHCEGEIRAAWLQMREPASPAARGLLLEPVGPGREGLLAFPAGVMPADDVWLTVQAKDGSLHRASIPLARLSPAAAAWVSGRESRPRPQAQPGFQP